MNRLIHKLTVGLALSVASLPATVITFNPAPGNGPAVPVTITISDVAGVGVSIQANVTGQPTGDIRGLFFELAGNSIPATLNCGQIQGGDVTGCIVSENNANDLGNGANMNGVYSLFDVAVEIGTPGIGGNDIQSTSFAINNNLISATQFIAAGIRLTSVSDGRGGRSESSKLIDQTPDTPVPEPATFGLVGVAGLAFGLARRRS